MRSAAARRLAPLRSLSPVFDGRFGMISSGAMGHPYRFVAWLTLVALVWAIFDALTGLALGIAIATNHEPTVGERAFIWFVVHGLSRWGVFVPGLALVLFPPGCILAWFAVDRWCKQSVWLTRARVVLAGWLLAMPLAALGPVAGFKLVELLAHDRSVVGQMLGLAGVMWCAGAACYVALLVQRQRERANQSRVSASWLGVAALLTTAGSVQIAWIGGLAIPLWVLWRSGRHVVPVEHRA